MCGGSYQPINCRLRCAWIDCYAGLGLAGSGFCFAYGAWWMFCCPEFKDEDDYLEEMQGYPEHNTETEKCWCNPAVEEYDGGLVIIHNEGQ